MKVPLIRREFELALMDVRRCLEGPHGKDRVSELYGVVWGMRTFVDAISRDPEKTWATIDIVRRAREMSGPGGIVAESELMGLLSSVAWACSLELSEHPASDNKAAMEILRQLSEYAMECLHYRRSRDTFGGRRRSKAFQILRWVQFHIEIPEAVQIARKIVETGTGNDRFGAMEFLEARVD